MADVKTLSHEGLLTEFSRANYLIGKMYEKNKEFTPEYQEETTNRRDARVEILRRMSEAESLRQQRDAAIAALEAINDWCGTDSGYQALPFEPPWYQQLLAALAKAQARP